MECSALCSLVLEYNSLAILTLCVLSPCILGRIGEAVAFRAKTFGFKIIFFDPYLYVLMDWNIFGYERVYQFKVTIVKNPLKAGLPD